MKSRYKGFVENILLALNVFIIFFILFGSYIVIPQWLQPIGRLHPLILHFPIVVLIMATVLEFFRFKERFRTEKLYHDFTTYLWLVGALLSAVTVVMGLFLSKEQGYEGGTLQWHKWLGVSVVFTSSVIYWCRTEGWYHVKMARWAAGIVVLSLTAAGHFGANLTHGDNFVLAPVWHPEINKVAIDKAFVYRDVIQPIFVNKCISCHNLDKIKGGLMLINEKTILKGGHDGKLFIPGQPQLSMLLQRIHLPEEEKKHMPPTGKPQLTTTELNLLYLWVKENADFKKKVIELPVSDSLRQIAATLLKPAEETEEHYDFDAADDKLIKKLNSNYMAIYSIARESPALGVDVYNKRIYTAKVLDELSVIKQQIVSLDLTKMPVKDAELKTIAQFENLRTLNLNFTDITGNSLKYLSPLKHLKSLSLAGTKINSQAIRQINLLKSLNKITIWDTGLPDAEVKQLQESNKKIEFIKSFKDDGKPIKLNSPQLKNTELVFAQTLSLQISHPIKGVNLRYTIDGTDPDSTRSALYKPGITLAQSAGIKVKAFKAGWLGSDAAQFNFYKSAYTPDSIRFITRPNQRYIANGARSLIDKEMGGTNFDNGKWIGSQKNLVVYMHFTKPVKLHEVTLNCLRSTGSQIFFPSAIQIWGGTDSTHLKLLSQVRSAPALKSDPFALKEMKGKLAVARNVSCLKIIAEPIPKLPAWDKVKKMHGWVFIDEIFFN